jgi:putative phosphoribosyl transferase
MSSMLYKNTLTLPVDYVELKGDLVIPPEAKGLVLFAHGSGSSRLSPRNQMVATFLNERGIATFLFDLLSYSEDREYANRFHLTLLTHRLVKMTSMLAELDPCRHLQPAFFGASTGAAAALTAASELPQVVAVVSRGGRPDLSMNALPFIKAPTLLIVGSLDRDVLRLNQKAYSALTCEKRLEVVEGATHLFEEAGAMEQVCELAAGWFQNHFAPVKTMY